jgi:hypothetical protein
VTVGAAAFAAVKREAPIDRIIVDVSGEAHRDHERQVAACIMPD